MLAGLSASCWANMELLLETKEDACSSCSVYMWQVKQIFHFSRKIKNQRLFFQLENINRGQLAS